MNLPKTKIAATFCVGLFLLWAVHLAYWPRQLTTAEEDLLATITPSHQVSTAALFGKSWARVCVETSLSRFAEKHMFGHLLFAAYAISDPEGRKGWFILENPSESQIIEFDRASLGVVAQSELPHIVQATPVNVPAVACADASKGALRAVELGPNWTRIYLGE